MIVKAHTSFIGETGYNCHARNFFKELHKLTQVQVRNFTVPPNWSGYTTDECFNDEYYIDDTIKTMLVEQTLHTENGMKEFPLYSAYKNEGNPDVHIVLNENYHHYFFNKYDGKKIAYNVWETTRYHDDFFNRLNSFDQVWVPSHWQKNCLVEQGMLESKVKVVPEGVDVNTYKPKNRVVLFPIDRPFRFLLVGRWDYRKSTKEIIETFTNTFSEDENVELLLSVDNPFATDGFNSTEERLESLGIRHSKIKVVHYLGKDDYVEMLKDADVFLSCARGEGWNLPLIEAMACGIPSIYSDWGAQLEFAKNKGIPVQIKKEVPASEAGKEYYSWMQNAPGYFAEPDFEDLSKKMRHAYEKFAVHKRKALDDSDEIRKVFTWERAAKIAKTTLEQFLQEDSDVISVVIARPDTARRKELLKNCIGSLKTEIILSTNYPIDTDIQNSVDYFLYSSENPILYKHEYDSFGVQYVYWELDGNGEKKYKPFEYEHGYAAYLLTRRGLELAKSLGKKKVHIINYDYEMTYETLSHNQKLLLENDLVLTTNEWKFEKQLYCSAFMSGKIEPLMNFFTKYNDKREYYTSIRGFNILELNLTEHYESSSYKIVTIPREELERKNKLNQEKIDNMIGSNISVPEQSTANEISINFIDSPFVEIKGGLNKNYNVSFIDQSTDEIVFQTKIKNNEWCRPNRKWFTNWKIEIQAENETKPFIHSLDLKGKRVFIVFESSSLGDTIAWIPYVEEFRKKHGCHVLVSTFHNDLFKSEYSDLEFVKPGTTAYNLYALYRIGCFYDNNGVDFNKHKTDFRKLPLQAYITDILQLDFAEIKPKLKKPKPMQSTKPYVCIANHTTSQSNYWNNPTGWQETVDYIKELGYDVYLLSREADGYMGNKNPKGVIKINEKSLEEISSILLGSVGFVGISSGLSWLAWGLGVPTCLISGRTHTYVEPTNNIYRIANESVCHGCFARHLFDKGDWNWCPEHKGTERQFECSKEIGFQLVKNGLDKMLNVR